MQLQRRLLASASTGSPAGGAAATAGSAVPHVPFMNARQTFLHVIKTEGFLTLYTGLSAAALRQAVYGGIGIGLYASLRKLFSGGRDLPAEQMSFWARMGAGMVSGGLGQLVGSPCDVVKVRLMADGRASKMNGVQPRYKGLIDAFRVIWQQEGLAGIFSGWAPNVQRAAIINAFGIASYDYCKHAALRILNRGEQAAGSHGSSGSGPSTEALASQGERRAGSDALQPQLQPQPTVLTSTSSINPSSSSSSIPSQQALKAQGHPQTPQNRDLAAQTVASLISGLISALVSTPFDVIRSRLMNQSSGMQQLYKNTTDCAVKIVRQEGFLTLYTGFTLSYVRLAPWQIIFFLTFERMTERLGLDRI